MKVSELRTALATMPDEDEIFPLIFTKYDFMEQYPNLIESEWINAIDNSEYWYRKVSQEIYEQIAHDIEHELGIVHHEAQQLDLQEK